MKPPPQFELLILMPFFVRLLRFPFVMCMYLLTERPVWRKLDVQRRGEVGAKYVSCVREKVTEGDREAWEESLPSIPRSGLELKQSVDNRNP